MANENIDDMFPPIKVGGGSDSRANWAYPGEADYPLKEAYDAYIAELSGKESALEKKAESPVTDNDSDEKNSCNEDYPRRIPGGSDSRACYE
jgi:hypothetical protein